MRTALLFGASGFIGGFLLDYLLRDPDYTQVTIVVRKPLGVAHPKLTELIGDYHTLPALSDRLAASDVYISLGTTKKNTPDEALYYQVDHDYPILAARIARSNGADTVALVSAVGPDLHSKVFYLRTKAETERDLLALDYPHTHIFRPSMLLGNRREKRPLEKFLIGVFRLINPLLIGSLRKFRGIEGERLAKAMIAAVKTRKEKTAIYEWKDIVELQWIINN